MVVTVKRYTLPPTALIPNSPQPVLHYPGLLAAASARRSTSVYDLFAANGWDTQWIYRYGPTQPAHYHSQTHEAMVVLAGTATVRLGADDAEDTAPAGAVDVHAGPGDVFVLPAGVAHKTFNALPRGEVTLLSPGNHGFSRDELAGLGEEEELEGFVMLGAYPRGAAAWDFATGGHDEGAYEKVWAVAKPARDPVLGDAEEGLCGQWTA